MNVCFFSNEGYDKILKQQYSLQDINILSDLGHNVTVSSNFFEIPWKSDLYFCWWASGSFLPLIKALISRKPIFVIAGGNEVMFYRDSLYGTPIGYLSTPFYKKIATRITLYLADEIFVVSEFMIDDVIKLCNRKPKVVYNSVDTNLFRINESVKREFITTVFNIEKGPFITKRGEIFLKSIPAVLEKFPDQKFIIIGREGNAISEFNQIVDTHSLRNNVKIISNIDNSEMPLYYQKSKIYIQLSDTETFGLSVAEAMSCGTPVIVSKRGALPNLVGEDGVFVDHNDPESVSLKMIELLSSDNNKNILLGKRLSKRINENFSYNIRKEKIKYYINLYFKKK